MEMKKAILAGTLGGLAGSVVMMARMLGAKKLGELDTPLPVKVERRIERRIGVADKTTPTQEKALAFTMHLLLGALFGAGYGALRGSLDLPAFPSGPLYGLGVWGLNLAGIGPLFDVTPNPLKEDRLEASRRLVTHLSYGAVLGMVTEQILRKIE